MDEICIVEKYPTTYDYKEIFDFSFIKKSLTSSRKDKVLKKDITLDFNELEAFNKVILVGAEPCKFIGKVNSVTEHQGTLVDNKYIPMLNPMAVRMKPSLEPMFNKSLIDIAYIVENGVGASSKELDIKGLQSEAEITTYLEKLLNLAKGGMLTKIAMDTETSALYPRDGYVLGISISHKEGQGVYLDFMYITEDHVDMIQELANIVTVIFHNKKFDHKFLRYHFGLEFPNWEDSMLEHYTLDESEGSHGLKTLAMQHTDLGDYDKELDTYKRSFCKKHGVLLKDFTYDLIPFDVIAKYAGIDTAATLELHNKFYPNISKNPKLMKMYKQLLKRGTDFLIEVEENGIPINIELTKQFIDDINNEIADLTKTLYSFEEVKRVELEKGSPFNVNSTAHKAYLFFTVLGLPVHHLTSTGNPSTDAETIEALSKLSELPKLINDIMKLKKVKSTYLEKYVVGIDRDGRLRTGFNLHTTTSGRLSSSGKLNAQQLPRKDKRPKRVIQAREGYKIVSGDLSTAEMWVAAVLSGDKALQKIFIDKVDYHGAMAVNKFNLSCHPNEVATLYPDKRQDAKTISFEILYKLNYNEPALENFPTLKRWLKKMEKEIKTNGYLYSHFGRKRRLQDVFSPNKKESQHQVRSGINFLVQSTSSDINLLAGIDMQDWIVKNGYEEEMVIFGLVHDSILAEVKEEVVDIYIKKLKEFMQKNRAGLMIPGTPISVDFEVGDNYADVEVYAA